MCTPAQAHTQCLHKWSHSILHLCFFSKWKSWKSFHITVDTPHSWLITAVSVFHYLKILEFQVSSVALSCPSLCNPADCSTPGFPVHHQLLELTQLTSIESSAIQPSHPLSSPSPPTFNLSQHQGLFIWVSSSHLVAKVLGVSASTSVLPKNTQDWSPLGLTGWISLQSKGFSGVFSNTQFKSINSLALSLLYGPNLTSIHDYWKSHSFE